MRNLGVASEAWWMRAAPERLVALPTQQNLASLRLCRLQGRLCSPGEKRQPSSQTPWPREPLTILGSHTLLRLPSLEPCALFVRALTSLPGATDIKRVDTVQIGVFMFTPYAQMSGYQVHSGRPGIPDGNVSGCSGAGGAGGK